MLMKKLTQTELNILKAWTDSREFGAAELLKRLLIEHTDLEMRLNRASAMAKEDRNLPMLEVLHGK